MNYRELIENSFSMLNHSAQRPNLDMLYSDKLKTFSEGFIWSGWWIQNSYGFTLGVVPFLGGIWRETLQKSYDLFWDRIGDGKRIGMDSGVPHPSQRCLNICAPDGSLGDCVFQEGIVYKQGDGDFDSYDWFYEATAAGVVMECEMLLFQRDPDALKKYIPLMRRSLDMIEKTRDESGLFCVGMCCNLLAPSFGGGYNEEQDTVEKSYLTGLALTYAGALERYIEVLKLAGEDSREYEQRLKATRQALPKLLTPEGYFCKSLERDGTMHGVYGAEKYGYFETSPNVDGIALGVVDEERGEAIYDALASVSGLRKFGAICANYPHLDDTYESYRKHTAEPHSLGWFSGDWVDGGCWATVEGRAILAYLRLGKYEDAFRSAETYMKWAEEYRQDAPLSQWGENTHNPWANEKAPGAYDDCRPVAVMVDNFAASTCLLRGLFGYRASADALMLTPRIPDEMAEYTQNDPVWFGNTCMTIAYESGTEPMKAYLGTTPLTVCGDTVIIPAELLAAQNCVTVTITRNNGAAKTVAPRREVLAGCADALPADVAEIYREARDLLEKQQDPASLDAQKLYQICRACESAAERRALPYLEHGLRPMTEKKKKAILALYDNAARALWNGWMK